MTSIEFDRDVLESAVSQRTTGIVHAVEAYTHLGGTIGLWTLTVVVAAALLLRRRPHTAASVVIAMAGGAVLMVALKDVWERDRPPLPERLVDLDSFAFPSGHAMMTAIFAAALASALWPMPLPRTVRAVTAVLLVLFPLTIGLSRVYLGAHWFTDVVAGWLFGLAWAALELWLYPQMVQAVRARRRRPA